MGLELVASVLDPLHLVGHNLASLPRHWIPWRRIFVKLRVTLHIKTDLHVFTRVASFIIVFVMKKYINMNFKYVE